MHSTCMYVKWKETCLRFRRFCRRRTTRKRCETTCSKGTGGKEELMKWTNSFSRLLQQAGILLRYSNMSLKPLYNYKYFSSLQVSLKCCASTIAERNWSRELLNICDVPQNIVNLSESVLPYRPVVSLWYIINFYRCAWLSWVGNAQDNRGCMWQSFLWTNT